MHPLVFDLGFHRGEDTAYYLAMGCRVVAVEASQELVAAGQARFPGAIASGELILVHGAVLGEEQCCRQPQVSFYPHPERSEWGTVQPSWVERNSRLHGLPHGDPVLVQALSLPQLVAAHGCPQHLKIDIEGADSAVLADLALLQERPRTISWETGKDSLRQVWGQHRLLHRLGYGRFRVMQQALQQRRAPQRLSDGELWRFPAGCSGPLPLAAAEPWRSLPWVQGQYLGLFDLYRLFGPGSLWARARRSRRPWLHGLPRWLDQGLARWGWALPGWYDSHAFRR